MIDVLIQRKRAGDCVGELLAVTQQKRQEVLTRTLRQRRDGTVAVSARNRADLTLGLSELQLVLVVDGRRAGVVAGERQLVGRTELMRVLQRITR